MKEEVLERRERLRSKVGFCLFCFNYFFKIFFWERLYGCEEQIWKDWELSGIGVCDVKFSKNQYKKYVLKKFDLLQTEENKKVSHKLIENISQLFDKVEY